MLLLAVPCAVTSIEFCRDVVEVYREGRGALSETRTLMAQGGGVSLDIPREWGTLRPLDQNASSAVLGGTNFRQTLGFMVESEARQPTFDPGLTLEDFAKRLEVAWEGGTMETWSSVNTPSGLPALRTYAVAMVEESHTQVEVTTMVTVFEGPRHFHIVQVWAQTELFRKREKQLKAMGASLHDDHKPPQLTEEEWLAPLDGGPAREPWSAKQPETWPQIVLTNDVTIKPDHLMIGASAFLMLDTHGEVFLGTAKHLLGSGGGIEPAVPQQELNNRLVRWHVHPRTRPDDRMEASGVAFMTPNASDWLMLSMPANGRRVSTPLRPRRNRARVGERVYLIGCPYSETTCQQNVYPCTVDGLEGDGFLCIPDDDGIALQGFSGAPLVDARGLLVGILLGSMSSDDDQTWLHAEGLKVLLGQLEAGPP
ncbi:MAG: serine protease [Myxococcota bacterium]